MPLHRLIESVGPESTQPFVLVLPQKLQELGPTLEELDSPEFQEASDTISEHAEQECDITLGE